MNSEYQALFSPPVQGAENKARSSHARSLFAATLHNKMTVATEETVIG